MQLRNLDADQQDAYEELKEWAKQNDIEMTRQVVVRPNGTTYWHYELRSGERVYTFSYGGKEPPRNLIPILDWLLDSCTWVEECIKTYAGPTECCDIHTRSYFDLKRSIQRSVQSWLGLDRYAAFIHLHTIHRYFERNSDVR